MKNMFVCLAFMISVLSTSCTTSKQIKLTETFTNPLLPSGADPYSFYKDGFYYYTHTLGNRIGLWKTKSLTALQNATYKTIYTPPPGTAQSKELWAPEVMFLQGKWYAYYAADDGNNNHHRLYVLENASPDPMQGEWVPKGQISDATNKWEIDGDVAKFMVNSSWFGRAGREM